MDQFFTSLNKRQTMLLLTAITFGGQEGVSALEHLSQEEADLLGHRAQGIMQIPREKRIPLLVQEIKRLVKDRRGQLWSAEPERLAELLKQERAALAEVVLRALPAVLADAVRAYLPKRTVKLTREVRPQVLDILRWKLEERLARSAGAQVSLKFTDVLQLQPRELLTVCDRLGARVLGPALAGLPEAQRETLVASLPPDQKQLAAKSIAANAPRKLPEEEAKEQLAVHDGLKNLSGAIRSAGVQRLARACVAQSAEFAARMLERHRGDFGSLLARWVRDERSKPASRSTDGGRADIVADMERLATRGLIERPVRLTPQRPALSPPPGGRPSPAAPGPAASREPPPPARIPPNSRDGRAAPPPPQAPRRDPMAEREARRAGAGASTQQRESAVRRDPMAERAARRAGALSLRDPAPVKAEPAAEPAPDGSRRHRLPVRESSVGPAPREGGSRREPAPVAPPREGAPDPSGARIGPPPSREREGSRVGSRPPPPEVGASRARREPAPVSSVPVPPRPVERSERPADPEGSRVIASPGARTVSRNGVRVAPTDEPERPPRVLSGRPSGVSGSTTGEGASVQRRARPVPPGNSGRGPRGGTR